MTEDQLRKQIDQMDHKLIRVTELTNAFRLIMIEIGQQEVRPISPEEVGALYAISNGLEDVLRN